MQTGRSQQSTDSAHKQEYAVCVLGRGMNQRLLGFALAAWLAVVGNFSKPADAKAPEAPSVLKMLEQACSKADGNFLEFHTYKATGIAWAGGASCTTPNVRLTCRESFCKAVSFDRESVAVMKYKASPDLGRLVSPEPGEFDRILLGLAVYRDSLR